MLLPTENKCRVQLHYVIYQHASMLHLELLHMMAGSSHYYSRLPVSHGLHILVKSTAMNKGWTISRLTAKSQANAQLTAIHHVFTA